MNVKYLTSLLLLHQLSFESVDASSTTPPSGQGLDDFNKTECHAVHVGFNWALLDLARLFQLHPRTQRLLFKKINHTDGVTDHAKAEPRVGTIRHANVLRILVEVFITLLQNNNIDTLMGQLGWKQPESLLYLIAPFQRIRTFSEGREERMCFGTVSIVIIDDLLHKLTPFLLNLDDFQFMDLLSKSLTIRPPILSEFATRLGISESELEAHHQSWRNGEKVAALKRPSGFFKQPLELGSMVVAINNPMWESVVQHLFLKSRQSSKG